MNTSDHRRPADGERILDHTRVQLSALVDGELAPDEAAFLMRRLRHDEELAGCWERWQLAGELLRGRGGARLPDGFGAGVMAAVAQEAAPAVANAARPHRWLRWGGGAVAASVALAALLLTRQAAQPQAPGASAQPPLIASRAATTPAPSVPHGTERAPELPAAPDTAAQLASAVVVADVPRRVAGARRGNAQAQRAAARGRSEVPPPIQVASAAPAATDPFSPRHALPAARPWPRSLTPGLPASGAFTVDYGGIAPASPSFYPFEPRHLQPLRPEPEPDVSP